MDPNFNYDLPDGASPDDNQGPVVTGVTLWMLVFSSVFVGLRCVSRLGIVKRWRSDDSFIVIAWVLAFGFSFTILWSVRVGMGTHQSVIQHDFPENVLPLRKCEYAFSVLYNPVLMATKTSILMFYLTISHNHRIFKWASIGTMVVVNVAGLALTLVNVAQCRPLYVLFEPTIPPGTCANQVVLYLASAPVNIVTDLAILFLPMPILTAMRLPRKQKIILVITFSFGAFVAAVDVVRISYLQSAFADRSREINQGDDDFSWYASLSFMWSAIEVHVGIICACVPSLKPLVAKILPSMLRDTDNPYDTSEFMNEQSPMNDSHFKAMDFGPSPSRQPTSPIRANAAAEAATSIGALPEERRRKSLGASSDLSTNSGHLRPPEAVKSSRSSPHGSLDGVSGSSSGDRGGSEPHGIEEASAPNNVARQDSEVAEMDFMEFLTTPSTGRRPPPGGISRLGTNMTRPTFNTLTSPTTPTTPGTPSARKGSLAFFDFYNMSQKKPMTKLTDREAMAPLAFVTILFFMWGFAYGLLDTLNAQFQEVVEATPSEAVGLHAAYYGGYVIGPLTVGWFVFKRFGYKVTFITGLCIYGVGTLIFWPSAVLLSYPAFVVSNLVIGTGVAILEVAANPFIALCGPPRHAETRLNISQGFQAIGTIVAPLLAKKVLFKTVVNASALLDVQWTYLGIALFAVVLSLAFVYIPIPEADDSDYEAVAAKRWDVNHTMLFGGKIRVVYVTLALGVLSNFMYVAAQESVSVPYINFVTLYKPTNPEDAFNYQTIGHTVFAIGRFICAGLHFVITPRTLLLILYIGMLITSALCVTIAPGPSAVAVIILYELFQSGVFPAVFAITLRGMGNHTKTAAILLAAATSGGAIFPIVVNAIPGLPGNQFAFVVVVATVAAGMAYPVYLAVEPRAQRQVDPDPKKKKKSRRRISIGKRPKDEEKRDEARGTSFGATGGEGPVEDEEVAGGPGLPVTEPRAEEKRKGNKGNRPKRDGDTFRASESRSNWKFFRSKATTSGQANVGKSNFSAGRSIPSTGNDAAERGA